MQHLRDMIADSLCVYEADPWYSVLDDQFGIDHLRKEKHLSDWYTLDTKQRALWLTGQLWNDRGIMPSDLLSVLELPEGSTYAVGVRKLRYELLQAAL